MNNLKEIKENIPIKLLQKAKLVLNCQKETKNACDYFKNKLNIHGYLMYTFMQTTNNEQLKTYLMLKIVQLSDKDNDLEKEILFLNQIEENLNKLIARLNNKESFTAEMMTFYEKIGVKRATVYCA